MTIKVIKSVKEIQDRSNALRRQGKTIVFVPTMGFLHDGHISLLKQGRKLGDDLILSIFVNPTQFSANEDLDTYPQDLANDLKLADAAGVDAVFTPTREMMYTEGYQTYVSLTNLPNYLCGISRPEHFRGVATVVTKLFNIVKPHVAVFGEKDYQQLAIIRQMVRDLNFDIEIKGGAIVREKDGLAMSSRNAYLTPEERSDALCLYKSLMMAGEMVKGGERKAEAVISRATEFINSHKDAVIDYISICDPDTLEDVTTINKPVLMALAVKLGKPRLIDNMILAP